VSELVLWDLGPVGGHVSPIAIMWNLARSSARLVSWSTAISCRQACCSAFRSRQAWPSACFGPPWFQSSSMFPLRWATVSPCAAPHRVALAWGDISQDLNRAINQPLQALQLIGQGWSEPIAVASKLTQRIHDKPRQNSRDVYGWLSRPYAEARTCCRTPDLGPAGAHAGTLTGSEVARASSRGRKTHE
jgi:hypothetical protein